ncbi:MAG: class I SAM-dependent methyltransferase [Candidatus Gottesmanbacteria bacterium]
MKQLKNTIRIIKYAMSSFVRRRMDSTEQSLFAREHIIKRTIANIIIDKFNGDKGQNTSPYFLGFGLIHYALIRNTKPKLVLCIGSRRGYVPALCALACKENLIGHVDFVDAAYDDKTPEKHWSGTGFWNTKESIHLFDIINVASQITLYKTTSKNYAKQFPQKHYDYVYIDGDHSYEGVKKDFQLFWPGLNPGGFCIFHDIVAHGYIGKGKFGVWKFWNELPNVHKITFPFPKESGLGILQK